MTTRIGVVIVTHESADQLPGLLESLAEHEPAAKVVVVDDASPSGPPDAGDATLIVSPENRVFAASCNLGVAALRRSDPRYVAFLNPDVRLAGPSLTEIADLLRHRRKVGIATGPIEDPDGKRLPSAWGPTSVRRALAYAAGFEPVRLRSAAGGNLMPRVAMSQVSRVEDDARVEGHVIGGTMVARLACLDDVGGFDEEFFLYWEDADLCHRARAAGWEIRVLPCTPFVHPRSDGVTEQDDRRWQWFVAGAERFGHKHLVPGQARQLDAALALGRRLARLRTRG
jgi:N-acetylglucosaminyl-diphospho-decaprenol L-rhamnosyltransferase